MAGRHFVQIIGILLFLSSCNFDIACALKTYDMDEYATCGRTVIVDDSGVQLNGRGDTAPSNPPQECRVHLLSAYREDDGTNKLQVEVLSFNSKGCAITVNLYNGHRVSGDYLQSLGCRNNYGSMGTHYSTGNEITVFMSRPDRLVQNEYQFALLFKPWEDHNAIPTNKNVDALPVGAIIGIVIACLIIIGVIILFCWCCCTGRIGNFNVPGRSIKRPVDNSNMINVKSVHSKSVVGGREKPGVIDFRDPQVWDTVTTGRYEPGQGSRRCQPGVPRNAIIGRRFEKEPPRENPMNRFSGHDYEPYEIDNRINDKYENTRDCRRSPHETRQPPKETLIDEVFDSDSNKGSEKTVDSDIDYATLQKRPSQNTADLEIPEEKDIDRQSPELQRYLSMDLESQPDQETISSPLHINAGVRASVDYDEGNSPNSSLHRKKPRSKSPRSRRKADGKGPDPMAMPPEAFEPIFTKPITGIDYHSQNRYPYGQSQGFPGGFIPYGLIPAGGFAPGTQTYAYAYQTVPHQGAPGQQGAWLVQNTPTNEGNQQTAFAVQQTISPDKTVAMPDRNRRKNSDPFRRGGNRGTNDSAVDVSVIARGAVPPKPGQGHRSIEMKSGMDPNSRVHTTQVLWTDTVPDMTDPKPDDNPHITRKTMTRVTTKSGYGELQPHSTLLALEDEEPAFLSPSTRQPQIQPALANRLPDTASPASDNLVFYTGTVASELPHERSSTPTSTHKPPSYNSAIRDRIALDDSTI